MRSMPVVVHNSIITGEVFCSNNLVAVQVGMGVIDAGIQYGDLYPLSIVSGLPHRGGIHYRITIIPVEGDVLRSRLTGNDRYIRHPGRGQRDPPRRGGDYLIHAWW
ncbi:MAG: hypothetical protein DDT30_01146 [Dehalococcoidia bacterium]|nr:hypothetical protein [Bacillota bacterium]MBT9142546.1 hypothetical protein [Bacillota bacterium]